MFAPVDAAMLRVATQPEDTHGEDWPDLTAPVPGAGEEEWIARTWADHQFAVAVASASPDLARQIVEVCEHREQRPRRVRSVAMSLLRYRLRATSRATPFGRFAGIVPTTFSGSTKTRIGPNPRAVLRVDATQLSALVAALELTAGVTERLCVIGNNTTRIRDGYLIVPLRPDPVPPQPRTDPGQVIIRYTDPVATVMNAAGSSTSVADLMQVAGNEYPEVSRDAILALVRRLIQMGALITNLRPPMTVSDPLKHVQDILADVGANEASTPEAVELLTGLAAMARSRTRTGTEVRDNAPSKPTPAMLDLYADAEVVLPHAVAAEAARAAGALVRLTPSPLGKRTWIDYHVRFIERYGVGSAVPLLDLINPDTGLGYPAGYRDSLLQTNNEPPTARDKALLQIAHKAAMQRQIEVALDDDTIATLSDLARPEALTRLRVAPHLELGLQIYAASRDSLDRGDFTLRVTSVFKTAGSTSGRFLGLLDPSDLDRMRDAYEELPTATDGALHVQMSAPPLYAETEAVARSPKILPQALTIAEHPHSENDFEPEPPRGRPGQTRTPLHPGDLLVIGDAVGMRLWSRSMNQVVEPMVFTAVEFSNFTHPLARFCCEISTARAANHQAFSWGVAADLPFLPRITYRRTILSPARWALTEADTGGRDASWHDWSRQLDEWLAQMMVPRHVLLGGNDQRIRLDLQVPAHRVLLRHRVHANKRVTLHEAPSVEANGWLDGHAHELVLPLAARQDPIPAPSFLSGEPARVIEHLPGAGDWGYCKIYGDPAQHTVILDKHLPTLLATVADDLSRLDPTDADSPPHWWFLPYRDPHEHLRVRLRLSSPDAHAAVTTAMGRWAADLRQRGLIRDVQFDTYRPETGRFGDGELMEAAESVFAADAEAARLERVLISRSLADPSHALDGHALDGRALTAASLLALATAFHDVTEADSVGAAARWLTEHTRVATGPAMSTPAIREQALVLADPSSDWASVRSLNDGPELISAWHARQDAVRAYRRLLTDAQPRRAHAAGAETSLNYVLASLLHLHCIRTLGIDPAAERETHRLAKAAALRHLNRRKASQ